MLKILENLALSLDTTKTKIKRNRQVINYTRTWRMALYIYHQVNMPLKESNWWNKKLHLASLDSFHIPTKSTITAIITTILLHFTILFLISLCCCHDDDDEADTSSFSCISHCFNKLTDFFFFFYSFEYDNALLSTKFAVIQKWTYYLAMHCYFFTVVWVPSCVFWYYGKLPYSCLQADSPMSSSLSI